MSAQDLHSLLPTHIGPLPPRLTSLASSLLQQSRTRISALKPHEEIARSYVCAHLACERLKNPLSLPAITAPRPPLPRRAYTALLTHFRGQLQGALKEAKDTPEPNPTAPEPAAVKKPGKTTLESAATTFSTQLSVPAAAPYIIRGVRSSRREGDDIRTVMAAVGLMVLERMCPIRGRRVGGVEWRRGEEYVKKRGVVVKAAGGGVVGKEVDRVVKRVSEEGEGWLEGVPERGRRWGGRGRMVKGGGGGEGGWRERVRREVARIEEKGEMVERR